MSTRLPDGRTLTLPVIPGILKHPAPGALSALLVNPDAARKYTLVALRHAAWPVLRLFPVEWLRECLDHAQLTAGRRQALLFLLR